MQVAYAYEMEKSESPRRARRKERLKELIDTFGGAARVARESGTPKSHFSAMLAGKRGLGDTLAAKLESLYEKPTGWFDSDTMPTAQAVGGPTVTSLDKRKEQRRRASNLEVLDYLIAILEQSDTAAREGLAGALPGLARNPSDPRAVAAVKAWISPAEPEHGKQAHG